ncbi:MAG: hypothetical protein ABI840_00355 [bacterium]
METNNKTKRINYVYFLIVLLTSISSQIISDGTIKPNVPLRMAVQDSILTGQMEAPYQYRIVKPLLGYAVQKIVSRFQRDPVKAHIISYHINIFLVFLGIFTFFYFYLRIFFSENVCMIGLLLLLIIIPLGVTSVWEEGDYITLLFYIIGFNLMFRHKDIFLPLLIAIGTLNRDQIIFFVVFYIIFLYDQKNLFTKRSLLLIMLCFAGYFISYFSMRLYFGFKVNLYTAEMNSSTNIDNWKAILGLWIEQVSVYLILSIIAFRKSTIFFRLSLLSLILYVIIFFFNSIMSQIAKILPAYLILIPMALQTLTGEKMRKYLAYKTEEEILNVNS